MRFLLVVVIVATFLSVASGFCRPPVRHRTFSIRYRGDDNEEKVNVETTSENKRQQLQNTAVVTGAVVGFVYWYNLLHHSLRFSIQLTYSIVILTLFPTSLT